MDFLQEQAREHLKKWGAPTDSGHVNMVANAIAGERERCASIALAIDSGRGNEKEIAAAIRNP